MLEEAVDRYGPLPDSVLNLADYGRIRVMADRLGIDAIDREGRIVVLKFRPQAKVDPARLVTLVRRAPGPDARSAGGLKLISLGSRLTASGATAGARRGRASPQSAAGATDSEARQSRQAPPPSWWTARAEKAK